MAMPYNVNDLLRLRFMGTVNGEPFQNVQHFRAKAPIVSIVDFQNAVSQGFLVEFRATMCDSAAFTSVGHARILPGDGDEEVEMPITPVVGVRNVHSLPNQIATLFKIRTSLNAPAGRGRLYIPSVPHDHFFNGRWTLLAESVLTSTAERLKMWVAEGGDNGLLEWHVMSMQTGNPTSNAVHDVQFANYPATMRSRRPTSS